ncbi:MAG: DsbE family thiol:disulfide interchange protein [SAR86 cluster bacterium]|nr:DsbE family thiol:disulfide interchange protein [SAR86 cluster bacterium]
MKKLFNLMPFILFCILLGYLYFLLKEEKQELNSALVGQKIPFFEHLSLDNRTAYITNNDLKDFPALINFWATWCIACAVEHPFLLEIRNKKNIPIYGVNYKDTRDKALNYLIEKGDPFILNIYDVNGKLGIDMGVYGAPETFLLNENGEIVLRHAGVLDQEVWNQKFRSHFAK